MPGPRMGPRPPDFDEELVKQSPTYIKWAALEDGQPLRYACRDFVKGHADDEERLMRRIMIARRNNIKDHDMLKRARASASKEDSPSSSSKAQRKRRPQEMFSDAHVLAEMDVAAVESTPSWKTWVSLEDGEAFVYNQKYIKGSEVQDWLLKKNIWRRMRYRRENKRLVQTMVGENEEPPLEPPSFPELIHTTPQNDDKSAAGPINDQETSARSPSAAKEGDLPAVDHHATNVSDFGLETAAVEAAVAVAVAESYANGVSSVEGMQLVHDPIEAGTAAALDAAARLAAATVGNSSESIVDDEEVEPHQQEMV